VSTVHEGDPGGSSVPIPALFAHLVDDTSLLLPRHHAPPPREVLSRYLRGRDGEFGGMVGQLACPVSRLPQVVAELAKLAPIAPVDLSLVVDTGLGAVPKALSLVMSRQALLTPCTVETPAPPDVDSTWLERVNEFVPDDVLAVVEPRRPLGGDSAQWLDAVRRVAEHGCTPKLRCGGPRASDVPSVDEVAAFVAAADGAPSGFTTSLGVAHVVRQVDPESDRTEHGLLNLLVAVARALVKGNVRDALAQTDAAPLVREVSRLSEAAGGAVRGLLARCGSGPVERTAAELAKLGLLDTMAR
jgi:hypothetical protein